MIFRNKIYELKCLINRYFANIIFLHDFIKYAYENIFLRVYIYLLNEFDWNIIIFVLIYNSVWNISLNKLLLYDHTS